MEHGETRRRLIVNADDFGISEEVNQAIVRAHKEGVLTSTSLMVTGDAFEDAVELAKQNPGLAVGIHLVTVMGRSALSADEIPSLVDEKRNFSSNPVKAGFKYFFSPRARQDLRKELAAQFAKFKATGLPLSHIDGHLHLHVHPVIFRAALDLGEASGVRRIRVPFEERELAARFDSSGRWARVVLSILFGSLARYMTPRLRARGFTFPTRVYGNLQSGKMNESYFLYVLDNLGAGPSEVYFHPAIYRAGQALSPEQRQLQTEFEALTSPRVAERIRALGIELTNYFKLEMSQ